MPPHRTNSSYPIRGSSMTPMNSCVVDGLENGSVLSFFSLLGGGGYRKA